MLRYFLNTIDILSKPLFSAAQLKLNTQKNPFYIIHGTSAAMDDIIWYYIYYMYWYYIGITTMF